MSASDPSCTARDAGSPSASSARTSAPAAAGARAAGWTSGGSARSTRAACATWRGAGFPTLATKAAAVRGARAPASAGAGSASAATGAGSAGPDAPGSAAFRMTRRKPWGTSFLIRASMGGWLANQREESPSAKRRWAASGAKALSSFEPACAMRASAPARPSGLRVNCTAAASARNSRWRDTAARMSRPKKAPTAPAAQTTRPAARMAPPALRLERKLDRERLESPVSCTRNRPTAASAVMPPMSERSSRLRRASPFRTCESSWATTPCSSSRVSRSSAPRVTATTARSGEKPAAKALMPGSRGST